MTLNWFWKRRTKQKKQTNWNTVIWLVYRTDTNARGFGWLAKARLKKLHARELSRSQSILPFDVILQHDWPIEQCLLYIRIFFGGKTKSPCFDLFIHWLIKQITNSYRNHFFKVIRKSLYLPLNSLRFRPRLYGEKLRHCTFLENCLPTPPLSQH